MKRTIIGSAFFAAPLIIAGTFAANVAYASNLTPLQIDSICTDVSSNRAVFAFENKNNMPINVNYTNLTTGATGSFVAPANSFYGDTDPVHNGGHPEGYAVSYDSTKPGNTISFTANDGSTSPTVQNVHDGVACTAAQAPVIAGGSGSGSGSTGGTVTTPVSTGTGSTVATGGMGGAVQTAATAAAPVATAPASLADTGASQILPYSLAALLAVATIGTTLAVRKNVL